MTAAVLGLLLLVGLAALYLALRVARAVTPLREPTTKWVKRSPVDRRQRQAPITTERRRGPRRQDDIARQYLAGVRPSRRPPRTPATG